MGVLPDWAIERDVRIEPFQKEQVAKGVISSGLSSYGYDMRLGHKFRVFTPTHSIEVDPKNFNDKVFVNIDVTPPEIKEDLSQMIREKCGHTHGLRIGNHRCYTCDPVPNHITIPPNSFALGESFETFTIPRDCLAVVLGKSTYARCGLIVNVTPLEPEWHGKVTIEISNTGPLPARVYAGEGIAQVLFFRTDGYLETVNKHLGKHLLDYNEESYPEMVKDITHGTCRTSYADKKGRYNNQTEITLPFIEKEQQ